MAAPANVPSMIVQAAQKYGVPPNLALEVANQESRMGTNMGPSPAGAIGVMQLEPATAASLGVDPNDPAQNIDGGVRYLAQLLAKFNGDTTKALAAYDWGPGHVSSAIAANGDNFLATAPAETQNYVQTILGNLGSAWQTTVTPTSVAAGTGDAISNLLDSASATPADSTVSPLLILTAFAIGVFILSEFVFDGD